MSRKAIWRSFVDAMFPGGSGPNRSRPRSRQRSLALERLESKSLLAADLTLDISDGGASVEAGKTVVYSFEYANQGDADATAAVLHTSVPRYTLFSADSSDAAWSCADGRFPWSSQSCTLALGDLAADASGSVNFAVTVDADLSSRVRHISSRGYISGDNDGLRRNDFGGAVTPILRQLHDLRIDVSDQGEGIGPGGTIVYTLDYANGGTVNAPGATISVTLPPDSTFDAAASSEGWTCAEGDCTLVVGEVAAGGEGVATIATTLDSDLSTRVRRVVATARIADDGSGAADQNRRNNLAVTRTSVVHMLPDLSIAIDDGDAGVAPGESIVYTVDYANKGTFDATGVTITMAVPEHTMFDSAGSSAGWTCMEAVCTFDVGNLAADSSGSIMFSTLVDADISADVRRIHASTSITDDGSAGDDVNYRNNRAFERIAVKHPAPDVSLQLNVDQTSVAPGGTLVYTLNYANAGTLDGNGAVIRLRLPRQSTFTAEGSSEGWMCTDRVCTLAVGNLAAGGSGSATLAVTADTDLSARVRHIYAIARIVDDGVNGPDANRFDNVAFVSSSVGRG